MMEAIGLLDEPTTENAKEKSIRKSRFFSALILCISFISQALSMGFYVSFGTLFVEIVREFKTTETKAGL